MATFPRRSDSASASSAVVSRPNPDGNGFCAVGILTPSLCFVSTHSFIRCTDSLVGYAGPKHLKAAIPVLFLWRSRLGLEQRRHVRRGERDAASVDAGGVEEGGSDCWRAKPVSGL